MPFYPNDGNDEYEETPLVDESELINEMVGLLDSFPTRHVTHHFKDGKQIVLDGKSLEHTRFLR